MEAVLTLHCRGVQIDIHDGAVGDIGVVQFCDGQDLGGQPAIIPGGHGADAPGQVFALLPPVRRGSHTLAECKAVIQREHGRPEPPAPVVGDGIDGLGIVLSHAHGDCIYLGVVIAPFGQTMHDVALQQFLPAEVLPACRNEFCHGTAPLFIHQFLHGDQRIRHIGKPRAHAAGVVVIRAGASDVTAFGKRIGKCSCEYGRRVDLHPVFLIPADIFRGFINLVADLQENGPEELFKRHLLRVSSGISHEASRQRVHTVVHGQFHSLGQVDLQRHVAGNFLALHGGLIAADEGIVPGVLQGLSIFHDRWDGHIVIDQDKCGFTLAHDAADLGQQFVRGVFPDADGELGVCHIHLVVDFQREIGQFIDCVRAVGVTAAKEEVLPVACTARIGKKFHPEVFDELFGFLPRQAAFRQVGPVIGDEQPVKAAHGTHEFTLHLHRLMQEIDHLQRFVEGPGRVFGNMGQGVCDKGHALLVFRLLLPHPAGFRRQTMGICNHPGIGQFDGVEELRLLFCDCIPQSRSVPLGLPQDAACTDPEEVAPPGAGMPQIQLSVDQARHGCILFPSRLIGEFAIGNLTVPEGAHLQGQFSVVEMVGEEIPSVHMDLRLGHDHVQEVRLLHDMAVGRMTFIVVLPFQ